MKRQILLHVGSPKCGSTYLQQVMLKNRAALLDRGIHYPKPPGNHPGNAADLKDIDAARLTALFEGQTHTVVLSHEDLYALPQHGRALADLARREGILVQVIAFLRPFSEFMFGDYSQFMKQHFEPWLSARNPYDGLDFDAFTRRRAAMIKPAVYLRGWARLFPEAPPLIASHRAIRATFEGLLGAETGIDWEVNRNLTNPSLRMEECDAIAEAMRDPQVSPSEIRAMLRAAFHRVCEADAGKSQARIEMAEKAFASQNAALLRGFGYDNRRA